MKERKKILIKEFCLSLLTPLLLGVSLTSCQESMEDKAAREAWDYTRKYCPTPVCNGLRTDSIVFHRDRKVYTYHVSFFDSIDDPKVVEEHKAEFISMLQKSVLESTSLKGFIEAGFKFEYVCRSGKNPSVIYLEVKDLFKGK